MSELWTRDERGQGYGVDETGDEALSWLEVKLQMKLLMKLEIKL